MTQEKTQEDLKRFGSMHDGYVIGGENDPNSVRLTVDQFAYTAALLPLLCGRLSQPGLACVDAICLGIDRGALEVNYFAMMKDGTSHSASMWVINGRRPTHDDHARLERNWHEVKTILAERIGAKVFLRLPRSIVHVGCPIVEGAYGKSLVIVPLERLAPG